MRPLYYDFSLDPLVVKATGANDPSVIHQFMFGAYVHNGVIDDDIK